MKIEGEFRLSSIVLSFDGANRCNEKMNEIFVNQRRAGQAGLRLDHTSFFLMLQISKNPHLEEKAIEPSLHVSIAYHY